MFKGTSTATGKSNVAHVAAKAAAPVATSAPSGQSVRPSHNLLVKQSKGDEYQRVTGLFANTSQKGINYISVTLKQDLVLPAGSQIAIFESTPLPETNA